MADRDLRINIIAEQSQQISSVFESLLKQLKGIDTGVNNVTHSVEELDKALADANVTGLSDDLVKVGDAGERTFGAITKKVKETIISITQMKMIISQISTDTGMSAGRIGEILSPFAKQLGLNVASIRSAVKDINQELKETAPIASTFEQNLSNATAEASKDLLLLKTRVVDVSKAIRDMKNVTGQSFQTIGRTFKDLGVDARVVDESVKELDAKFKDISASGFSLNGILDRIGRSLTSWVVGGTIFAVVGAFQQLGAKLREASEAAIEWITSSYKLEIGLRAMQRAGSNVALKDLSTMVAELSNQFQVLSKLDIEAGLAQILFKTRDLGLSAVEIQKLAESIAVFTALNPGKTFKEAADMITLFIASGKSSGIQSLGLTLNGTMISQEALNVETERGIDASTQAARGWAAYNLVVKNAGLMAEDASKIQETLVGKLGSVENQLKQMWTNIGADLLIVEYRWKTNLLNMTEAFSKFVNSVVLGYDYLVKNSLEKIISDMQAYMPILEGAGLSTDNLARKIEQKTKDLEEVLADIKRIESGSGSFLGDFTGTPNAPGLGGDALNTDEIESLGQKRKDLWQELIDDEYDARLDYARKLLDLETELNRDLEDLDIEHYRRVAEISEKAREDEAKALLDYGRNLEDAERSYQDKLADIRAKQQEDDLKAEKKYQDKLFSLRMSFEESLDEAIRVRDARKALELIKKYDRDKQIAKRTYEDEKSERKTSYEDEIRDAQIERDRKLADLAQDFADRRAEILRQEAQDYADEVTNWNERVTDRQKRYTDALIDAKTNLDRKLADILTDFKDASEEIELQLSSLMVASTEIVAEGVKAQAEVLRVGAKNLYDYASNMVQLLRFLRSTARQQLQLPFHGNYDDGGSQALGGNYLVNKPTRMLVGEAGAEVVSIRPLTRPVRNVTNVPGGIANNVGIGGGNMHLLVELTPGLQASIVNNTINEITTSIRTAERYR